MIITWLISALAVFLTAQLLSGIEIKNYLTAIYASLILALANVFVKPIVEIITLPINILTLGLFTLVINALMVLLVAALVKSFRVKNFWWAILFGLVIYPINFMLSKLIGALL